MPSCTQKVPCRSDMPIMHSSHAKFGLTVTRPTVPHSSTHATNKYTKQRSRRCARPRWEGWYPSQLSTRTGWAIPPRWPPSCNCRRSKPVLSQYLPKRVHVSVAGRGRMSAGGGMHLRMRRRPKEMMSLPCAKLEASSSTERVPANKCARSAPTVSDF